MYVGKHHVLSLWKQISCFMVVGSDEFKGSRHVYFGAIFCVGGFRFLGKCVLSFRFVIGSGMFLYV